MTQNAICVYDITFSKRLVPDEENIKKFLRTVAKAWCFQEEKSTKDGKSYEHYQTRFSLKLKERKNTVMKKIKEHFGYDKINPDALRPTSKENSTNFFYVFKEDTWVGGDRRWSDKDDKGEIIIPWDVEEINELRPFQQSILEISEKREKRNINILIDPLGDKGKTAMVRWIHCNHKGTQLPAMNDAQDLMRAVYDLPFDKAYYFDLPRAMPKKKLSPMFTAIEQIKTGYCYDDRYRFKQAYFGPPVVWVFSNFAPDTTMLTSGRWKFWEINEKMQLKPFKQSCIIGD